MFKATKDFKSVPMYTLPQINSFQTHDPVVYQRSSADKRKWYQNLGTVFINKKYICLKLTGVSFNIKLGELLVGNCTSENGLSERLVVSEDVGWGRGGAGSLPPPPYPTPVDPFLN